MKFKEIDESNFKEAINLQIKEHQRSYLSNNNAYALAKAYVFRNEMNAYAIYDGSIMIGFCTIRKRHDLGNYSLEKLMIDEKYQGKGYGRKALKSIIEQLKRENAFNKFYLCCHVENKEAMELYISHGFVEVEPEEEKEVVLGIEW